MSKHETALETIKMEIDDIIQKSAGTRIDAACKIYNVVASASGHEAEALQYFYEHSEEGTFGEQNPTDAIFDVSEQFQLVSSYGKMIDGALEALLRQNMPCKEFYAKLWEYIAKDTILSGAKEKAFALFYIWIDVRIPYFELEPGLKMSNEVYQEVSGKLRALIKKARFILYAPVEQKTERASRILKLVDGVQDEKERAVLTAWVLAMNERKIEAAPEREQKER